MEFQEFYEFWGISLFPRKRGPFSAHAPKRCYYKAILMVFLVISARIALFRKMAQIPQISLNFTKFRGISRNLVNFTKFSHFGAKGPVKLPILLFRQLFKAEMVRFREHFRIFAKCQLFARKTLFSRKPGSGAQFPTFLVQNALFRLGASKRPPRSLCL